MYGWIFKHLPGPKWLKVIESIILILAVAYALLEWGFPWAQEYFHLGDATV
ncbi:hypothetical protein [Gleimia hominis]|uniref:Uncharacterized protein n=1 Tax=Gleimia hominis TaxID=595468 RepID=A0ABU3I8V4_9ACTO|nr:hypothetical protein [Gleimia hominis]MDT3766802.1 hypothetical protein [Gleimia hominis]WIK64203.1 hypothetical protein CJ187_007840 [Gleimia hominis]